jgi:hypothetical protein
MSHNPNTVKSQDDLSTTNDGKRSSDVLLSTIEELERTKKQLEIAVWALYLLLSGIKTIKIGKSEELIETYALNKIEELNK